MPNFWTKTNQTLYEVFYGPKTVDAEFNEKLEEIKHSEKNLLQFQQMLSKFHQYNGGIRSYFNDLVLLIENFYTKDSAYFTYTSEITSSHKDLIAFYDTYESNIMTINQNLNVWGGNFENVKHSIKEREKMRLIYEHYDEKMEKYVDRRNKYFEKNQTESNKFIEGFERNNLKYKAASQNYIAQSKVTYRLMCEFLDFRNKLINPLISQIIQQEIIFFSNAKDKLMILQNIGEKMHSMDEYTYTSKCAMYDPTKYIRGKTIIAIPMGEQGQTIVQPVPITTIEPPIKNVTQVNVNPQLEQLIEKESLSMPIIQETKEYPEKEKETLIKPITYERREYSEQEIKPSLTISNIPIEGVSDYQVYSEKSTEPLKSSEGMPLHQKSKIEYEDDEEEFLNEAKEHEALQNVLNQVDKHFTLGEEIQPNMFNIQKIPLSENISTDLNKENISSTSMRSENAPYIPNVSYTKGSITAQPKLTSEAENLTVKPITVTEVISSEGIQPLQESIPEKIPEVILSEGAKPLEMSNITAKKPETSTSDYSRIQINLNNVKDIIENYKKMQ